MSILTRCLSSVVILKTLFVGVFFCFCFVVVGGKGDACLLLEYLRVNKNVILVACYTQHSFLDISERSFYKLSELTILASKQGISDTECFQQTIRVTVSSNRACVKR